MTVPPNVTVVDDSPDMRWLLRDMLEAAGYRVSAYASGAAALNAMVHGPPPDLVITDLLMPGVNGFNLRMEMLRRPALASVPVIVISAHWARTAETLQAEVVLTKPLNLDRFLEAVARAAPIAPSTSPYDGQSQVALHVDEREPARLSRR